MMEWFRLKKLTILKAERARQPSRRAVHKVLWMRTLLWTLEPKTIQVYAKPNQSPADDPRSSDSQTAGTASFGAQEGPMQPSRAEIQSSTNPLRFLGDSLKEIRQRFDDIITREQRDIPREKIGDVDVPSQVEYLQPDDVDHDMEALGPAEEEQAAKLNDLKLIDGDQQTTEYAPMDIDLPSTRTFNKSKPHDEPTASEPQNDVEGAILQNACPISDELAFSSDTSTRKADVDMEDMADEAVEAGLRAWQITGFPDTSAEKDIKTGNILVNHVYIDMYDTHNYCRRSLRSQGKLTYAFYDFDGSTMFPPSMSLDECRLPSCVSYDTFYDQRPGDTLQGELDFNPFAFDVGMLGVMFCKEFQHMTHVVPMWAPLFDRMTTRDVGRRFKASEALQFFEEQ
ncbi:hypothetical protein C0995_013802, partial [Termitomyces sp. Mi166